MVDWPGRVAASIRLSGCSFRCPYCSTPELLAPFESYGAWEGFLGHLHDGGHMIEGVVVTGGEPTDDPDLPAVLARIQEAGVPVRLETNGSRPSVLRYLVAEALVDSVALDIKASLDHYDALTGVEGSAELVAESISTLRSSSVEHEFRTTLFPGAVTLDDLEPMAASLAGGRLWVLQQYRPDRALDRRAEGIDPFATEAVRTVVRDCRRHLPTILRGFAGVAG